MTWRRALLGLVVFGALLIGWNVYRSHCWSARIWYGVVIDECPAGRMRPAVELAVEDLRRGSPGVVRVMPLALYTYGSGHHALSTPILRGSVELTLLTASATIAVTPKDGWARDGDGELVGRVTLPADLPDGRHTLVASMSTPLGQARATMRLAVFAPAKVLVMTDRPLYEAGNLVKFRAVVLRARDRVPLDGRPGDWVVTAPDGTVVLEERAPAGDFGVAAGDFPLDEAASTGTWTVAWRSGHDEGKATFRVEPFELPRFTIDARSVRPHYGRGERPTVRGALRYASGAPVANASVRASWRVRGGWPPPASWSKGDLPLRAETDDQGRFELKLARIPVDLVGRATVVGWLVATDSTGDRVSAGVEVLLSEDDLEVSAVTELGDGLVEGFNNRLYLRATTPSGRVLGRTKLQVTRAWDPTDAGQTVETDVDGVAALQIDPGPAVTVVEPKAPLRPAPPPPPVTRLSLKDHLRDAGPTLGDQSALDRALGPLAACARWAAEDRSAKVIVTVTARGDVSHTVHESMPLADCAARKLAAIRFPPGRARMLQMYFRFTYDGPDVELSFDGPDEPPAVWQSYMNRLAVEARPCLPPSAKSRGSGRLLQWTVDAAGRVTLEALPEPRARARAPKRVTDCLVRTLLAGRERTIESLGGPKRVDPAAGLVRIGVTAAPRRRETQPQSRTYLGYELAVKAMAGDETVGETKVRLRPGSIPPLRLRASPVVAEAGETVEVKVLRGPDFSGELPKKLVMMHEGNRIEAELSRDDRTAHFALPEGRAGWFEVRLHSASAVVFVPDRRPLAVEVAPDAPRYRPGQTASLIVRTTAGGQPTPAMVGLFGVDETLGQLAPLPGPDVWSQLLAVPDMAAGSAFGALDAVALASGRVRGRSALAATVIKVTRVPPAEALDRSVSRSQGVDFDPIVPLTDAFYELLARLFDRVREWDARAPAAALMTPPQMAKLWNEVLGAAPADRAVDAFGRRLRLGILPDDLLRLVDPRVVVTNGTRLPEDVDNWIRWVRRNRP